eukprot:COSAG06_NODE_11101_length_1566_cov_7.475119_3_plen_64_part_00
MTIGALEVLRTKRADLSSSELEPEPETETETETQIETETGTEAVEEGVPPEASAAQPLAAQNK